MDSQVKYIYNTLLVYILYTRQLHAQLHIYRSVITIVQLYSLEGIALHNTNKRNSGTMETQYTIYHWATNRSDPQNLLSVTLDVPLQSIDN